MKQIMMPSMGNFIHAATAFALLIHCSICKV